MTWLEPRGKDNAHRALLQSDLEIQCGWPSRFGRCTFCFWTAQVAGRTLSAALT